MVVIVVAVVVVVVVVVALVGVDCELVGAQEQLLGHMLLLLLLDLLDAQAIGQ